MLVGWTCSNIHIWIIVVQHKLFDLIDIDFQVVVIAPYESQWLHTEYYMGLDRHRWKVQCYWWEEASNCKAVILAWYITIIIHTFLEMFCNMIGLAFKPCLLLEALMYVNIYKRKCIPKHFWHNRHLPLLRVRGCHEAMDLAEVKSTIFSSYLWR